MLNWANYNDRIKIGSQNECIWRLTINCQYFFLKNFKKIFSIKKSMLNKPFLIYKNDRMDVCEYEHRKYVNF